jgi:hypothetical protein
MSVKTTAKKTKKEVVSTKKESTKAIKEIDLKTKPNNDNRTLKGFKLLGLGAISLFLGCITNLTLPITNEYFHYILYGVTSIGASIVFYGLYLVMEKP